MDGIVNVNKPLGITSHDVVYRLRKITGVKKIGHTGTLDPDADGVLPMCIGKGTKLAEMLTSSDKQYLAQLTLGVTTDTQDKSGTILKTCEVCVTEEEIQRVVNTFVGKIQQIPPMYSAIKIDGKKLYELAREGKTVERKPRCIEIFAIDVKEIDLEKNTVTFLVDCSKGTYIRTLCSDIGEALGCGGHMSSLTRTRSGRFKIEDAYTLETLEGMAKAEDFGFITPVSEALSEFDKIFLGDKNAKKVCNGVPIRVEGAVEGKTYRVFDENNNFLALAQQQKGRFVILRPFFDGSQSKG